MTYQDLKVISKKQAGKTGNSFPFTKQNIDNEISSLHIGSVDSFVDLLEEVEHIM